MAREKRRYCPNCGTTAVPKSVTPGSILIELIAWLCFIVPGVIYSLWRHSARHPACPSCGNKQIVPLDSPIAKKAAG